jgi:hypothetical protein
MICSFDVPVFCFVGDLIVNVYLRTSPHHNPSMVCVGRRTQLNTKTCLGTIVSNHFRYCFYIYIFTFVFIVLGDYSKFIRQRYYRL